jgi:hypothetical protein
MSPTVDVMALVFERLSGLYEIDGLQQAENLMCVVTGISTCVVTEISMCVATQISMCVVTENPTCAVYVLSLQWHL